MFGVFTPLLFYYRTNNFSQNFMNIEYYRMHFDMGSPYFLLFLIIYGIIYFKKIK